MADRDERGDEGEDATIPALLGWALALVAFAIACWALWGILEPLIHHYARPLLQP
jgi:hypothetical protein